MRILDLFCGEGGAAWGYYRAGFTVTGVDLKANGRYPFRVLADNALDILRYPIVRDFDAIHASPPCQAYTRGNAGRQTSWPRIIAPVRELLEATGKPYIIENVADAASELIDPVKLCGCMFDLSTIDDDGERIHLQRARLFETNFPLTAPRPCDHTAHQWVAGAYGGARRDKHEAKHVRKGGYVPPNKDVVKRLMGIEHDMTWAGLFEAIPPSYSEWIGRELLAWLGSSASTQPGYEHAHTPDTSVSPGRNTGSLPSTDAPSGSASFARSLRSESAATAVCSPQLGRGPDATG